MRTRFGIGASGIESLQQLPCLDQRSRLETLGEPVDHRLKHVPGFGCPALRLPKTGQRDGGLQLKGLHLLSASDLNGLQIGSFGPGGVVADSPRTRAGVSTLVTPPLSAGALEGITRNLVIQLARDAGMSVIEANLARHDLYIAEEMFLTGTAAEVIPVVDVDGRPIGNGEPGPITRQLITAFRNLVADAPED